MAVFHSYGELAVQHLTGNLQVRQSWFGKQILQVEIKSPKPNYPRPPIPDRDVWEHGSYTFWRDADAEDLRILRGLNCRFV